MPEIGELIRYAVFGVFALSVVIASAAWLVRTRRVSPFGALGRALRGVSEPIIRPIESRLVRSGGNPVNAGWWLVAAVTVGGLVLLAALDWGLRTAYDVYAAIGSGPRATLEFTIGAAYDILFVALVVRVIASWFGVSPYSRWMRPVIAATDWIIQPIRRILPPLGMIDMSPMVAWLVLYVLRGMLVSWI
jgi:YggT family protein